MSCRRGAAIEQYRVLSGTTVGALGPGRKEMQDRVLHLGRRQGLGWVEMGRWSWIAARDRQIRSGEASEVRRRAASLQAGQQCPTSTLERTTLSSIVWPIA